MIFRMRPPEPPPSEHAARMERLHTLPRDWTALYTTKDGVQERRYIMTDDRVEYRVRPFNMIERLDRWKRESPLK